MATFKIYLGQPYASELCPRNYDWAGLCRQVKAVFDPVIASSNDYDTLVVTHSAAAPAIETDHLLCYVLPTHSRGYQLIGPWRGIGTNAFVLGGFTYTGSDIAGSEVYMNQRSDQAGLARLIVHELMHNKLEEDDQALHRRNGLAERNATGDLSSENVTALVAHLGDRRQQWTGGWEQASALDNLDSALPF